MNKTFASRPGLRSIAAALCMGALSTLAQAAPSLVGTLDLSTWAGNPVSPWTPPFPPSPYPGFSLTSLAFDPVRNTLYVADSATSYVYLVDTNTHTVSAVSNTLGAANPAGNPYALEPLTLLANPASGRWSVMTPYFGAKFLGTELLQLDASPAGTMPAAASWDPFTNVVYSANTNFFAMLNLKFLFGGFACSGTSNATTFNAATNRAYVSCGFSDAKAGLVMYDGITLLNANKKIPTQPVLATFPGRPGTAALGLAVNPNTNRVYAAGLSSATSLDVFDGTSLQWLASIPGLTDVNGSRILSSALSAPLPLPVAVNSRTNTVFVLNPLTSTVSIFDGNTNTLTGTLNVWVPAGAVIDNPGGEIKIGNTIYDGRRGVVTTLGGAVAMAVNEPGNLLYVASVNGTVDIYALDAPAVATTYSISGIVLNSLGAPLPGAKVTATGAAGPAATVTDSQGQFVLTGVAPGAYSVQPVGVAGATYLARNVAVNTDNVARLNLVPAGTKTFTVSVGRSNPGTVTATPAGTDRVLDCGSSCSAKFNPGTAITLAATPPAGQTFLGWDGACTGTSPSCNLVVTSDLSVKASFSK